MAIEPGFAVDVEVQVVSSSESVPVSASLQAWVASAMDRERAATLTLRVVDETESSELNERYRAASGPTNVLAFPAGDLPPDIGDEPPPLGDIVICAAVVEREAAEQGKSLDAHWAHICIHGALHLVGFDHEAEDEAKLMEAREVEILRSLGFPDPYIDAS
ncbi:MAG: rRNA maturation RNase YbeY [Gammaproteobacteria bacterium]